MNYEGTERKTSGCCYRSCVSRAYFQRISFLSFVVVVLFFVEADNMHDDVSTYFALVYRRREPVLVMKRVKRQAMFRPSWKFEGKPNSIPPQFFVLCFRVFLGGLRFRGLRFLGGLRFRGLWSSVFGLRFLDTPGKTEGLLESRSSGPCGCGSMFFPCVFVYSKTN